MSTSNNNLLPSHKINNVCVIGGGLMGSGIAAVCAFHGYHVGVVDLDVAALEDARKRAQFQLAKMFEAKRKGTQGNGIHNKVH
jgi:3-hydroxyacyl-CoA dehydrogenase